MYDENNRRLVRRSRSALVVVQEQLVVVPAILPLHSEVVVLEETRRCGVELLAHLAEAPAVRAAAS